MEKEVKAKKKDRPNMSPLEKAIDDVEFLRDKAKERNESTTFIAFDMAVDVMKRYLPKTSM